MTAPPPNVVAVADHAVLVVFDDEINEATLARIRWLDSALARNPPLGIVEVIPALTSVLVDFDPVVTDHANITAAVIANLDGPANTSTGAHHIIDVCYDDEFGPDLSDVAARSGLDSAAVIATHLSGSYAVGMYGFAPGYAYLYGTPPAIQLARNPTPGPLQAGRQRDRRRSTVPDLANAVVDGVVRNRPLRGDDVCRRRQPPLLVRCR